MICGSNPAKETDRIQVLGMAGVRSLKARLFTHEHSKLQRNFKQRILGHKPHPKSYKKSKELEKSMINISNLLATLSVISSFLHNLLFKGKVVTLGNSMLEG